MPQPGDRVQIRTKKGTEKGLLMPSPDEKAMIIKLGSGYNVGFEKKEIKDIMVLKKKEETPPVSLEKVASVKNLKTISLLHCGGTIASKVDYETGAVKAKFSPEELLEMFPELKSIVNLRSQLVANMLSENMRLAHYNLIAKAIEKEVKAGTAGIIVTHGTDTLHYTAAALSFILENLPLPVLLVGAQRSSDRGSSDAFLNLKSAAYFIAHSDFAEVAICMHSHEEDDQCAILPGLKSRKMHSSRRDAFKTINARPWALVDESGKTEWLRQDYRKRDSRPKLHLRLFKEKLKIGLLKAHPQMFAGELKIFEKFDGLVLEGTGLGHFPSERCDSLSAENALIFQEIEGLAKKIPVVMTTQTIFGGVNLNVYSPGRKLIQAGVLGNGLDLTAETAWVRLAWLLSHYEPPQIKDLWNKNFRGEISFGRTYQKDFLK